jgi:N-acetylneuraminate synthase
MYPGMILGLSDHTPGHATVLGAVSLGARVIEKHFTDNRSGVGPDHAFSMEPHDWNEMVERTRELEAALGTGVKKVENNEMETVILQRRCARARRDICAGEQLGAENIEFLRPCPVDAVTPLQFAAIKNPVAAQALAQGDCLRWHHLKMQ